MQRVIGRVQKSTVQIKNALEKHSQQETAGKGQVR